MIWGLGNPGKLRQFRLKNSEPFSFAFGVCDCTVLDFGVGIGFVVVGGEGALIVTREVPSFS